MKHTPGPWTATTHYVEAARSRDGRLPWGFSVCDTNTFSSYGMSDDERHSNARLIAAAPEMLDELLPIAELYHAWIADDTGTGHPRVSHYASDKPREERLAGISLNREQVLRIVALVDRIRKGPA